MTLLSCVRAEDSIRLWLLKHISMYMDPKIPVETKKLCIIYSLQTGLLQQFLVRLTGIALHDSEKFPSSQYFDASLLKLVLVQTDFMSKEIH